MRVEVSFKHMKSSDYLDNVISKDVEKVRKRIKIFKRDDPVHLSLHIEKNPHKEEFLSWANLYMPKKVIKSQQKDRDPSISINKVVQMLIRQIDKYKIIFERRLQRRKGVLDIEENIT